MNKSQYLPSRTHPTLLLPCPRSGTPPSINISALAREFDACMPLGPLSPAPLSPSILTLCSNGLQAFGGGGGDGGAGGSHHTDLWMNSYSNLPDMRECSSPLLQSCESPPGACGVPSR